MIPKLKIIANNATEVTVSNVTLYFSYETCVAFSCPNGRFKTEKRYSQTTSKHKTLMGVTGFTELEESVFNEKLQQTFSEKECS